MRQLTLVEPGVVEWHEVPDARIEKPGDALVRPIAVTTCDGDGPMIWGRTPFPLPIALGHEFVGEVVDFGEEVVGFHRGQLVVVSFQICCGDCDRCRAGLTGSCRAVPPRSMFGFGRVGGNWGGALSDLLRVPFAANMLVPVPHGVSPQTVASAGDNLADAWRTVAPYLRESPGADVLVVGGTANSVALYAVAIARALGASRVDYLDTDPTHCALARTLGGNAIEGPLPRQAGEYAITVDASANHDGLACALRSVAPGGVCTSVGIYFFEQTTPVPLLEMFVTGVRFYTGRVNARAHMSDVLELVQTGRIHPERITSAVAAWEDAPEALTDLWLKPVISRAPTG